MKKLVTISKLTLLAALAASNLALAAGKRPAEDDGGQQPKHLRADADQQVPAGTTITLVTSDEQNFHVSVDLAMLSGTIKNMLGDSADTNQSFPLANVSSATLQNLIPCLEIIHAGKNNQTEICTALTALITQYDLSPEDLADLINAANFLDIPQVLQAALTSQPLLERAVILGANFPQEIQDMMSWLQTIFSSRNNQELDEKIKKVRTTNIFHDPVWMCVIIDTLITSNKFGTAQDLFLLMARAGLVHGIQALLNRGADVNYVDQKGWAALIWAACCGHIEAVEFCLKAQGFDPNAKDQLNAALTKAAGGGHAPVIKLLLGKAADVNYVDQKGETALFWAAFMGHAETVELLLNAQGFDPNANNQLTKALLKAVQNSDEPVLKLLLLEGADVNHLDQFGLTLLMWAAFNGHIETVELLLNAPGFDPHAHNQLNKALQYVNQSHKTETVALLKNYLAAQNAQALPVAEGQ